MEPTDTVRFHAVPHPSQAIRRTGFALDDPYLEECWASVLGPTSVLLLRRLSRLWELDLAPAVKANEFASCLGVGHTRGRNGALQRTLDRLIRYRFASPAGPGELDVFTQVAPLPDGHLRHVPRPIRLRHEELLDIHLARLAELSQRLPGRDIVGHIADTRGHDLTRTTPTLRR